MIHPDEALRIIDSIEVRLSTERVPIDRALGRIPARDPVSRVDQPPFDKATMDGFAYAPEGGCLAEVGEKLQVVGSIAAGEIPALRLGPGECVRIMTGAPLPEGASAVHRLERATESAGSVVITRREDEPNVIRRAMNRAAGEIIFSRRPLKAQDIGILAANGIAEIEVVRKPIVRIISTGNELVPAGSSPTAPGLIYDSNGPQLVAQAVSAGCDAAFAGIVRDDESRLAAALDRAAAEADLVVVSGAVSAGDFDYVPTASERAGFSMLFHRIAMKPGKPAFFGRRGDRFVYGVPGNPVAAFVNFDVMIRPLLFRLCGLSYRPALVRVRAGSTISRRELERVEYLPVEIKGGSAFPLRYTGSTMLDALTAADALVRLEIGAARIEAGEEIDARLI